MNNNRRVEASGWLPPAFLPWAVWSGGAIFFCYVFFQRMAPSVMVGDIMRDFGIGGAVLGNLSAFYFYAYASLQLPVGVTIDRFGPRRVLTAAAVLCGAGSLMFALATTIGIAYIGRLLVGAGAAFALIGTLKLGTVWFPSERFALVTGLTTTLGSVGAIAGQAPLAAVIEVFGWRATMVAAAGVAVAIGALIWMVARDQRDDAASPVMATLEARPRVFRGIGGVLATPHNWAMPLVMASITVPLLAFAGLWGVPFLMEAYGLERPAAAATTSIFLIGHGIGSAPMGWLSDRIRRRKLPTLIGVVGTIGTITAVIFVPDLPLLAAQVLLFVGGLASGANPIAFAFTREHNPAERAATAMGFINLVNMAITAAFQPLLGWLLDLGWDGRLIEGARIYSVATYRTAFLSMVALGIVGIVAALLVRETHCRPLESRGDRPARPRSA